MSDVEESAVEGLTPRRIVDELSRYIVGQDAAKRAIAVAVRNRARRRAVDPAMRDEIAPKNILMIGPTGVGKTEIARRMANLVGAPFLKVEATKFTEVGYVGRDVDSMVRDLANAGVNMVRREHQDTARQAAEARAEEALLDLLLPPVPLPAEEDAPEDKARARTREKFRTLLAEGAFEDKAVELETTTQGGGQAMEIFSNTGMEEMDVGFRDLLSNILPSKRKQRRMTVAEARRFLVQQETDKLVDMDRVVEEAVRRVEEMGIVFIDEIDKIAGREGGHGPEVSREGVQRDILPIVEGSTVNTRYGPVRTDHVLFIAAGAFHVAKPTDLIPELQGRFPVRVELSPLAREDLKRILVKPKNALVKQYVALLATEGLSVRFDAGAVDELARVAEEVNSRAEDIGARRLHGLLEKLLEDLSYHADERTGQAVVIDRAYVRGRLGGMLENRDLSQYIL